MKSLILPAFCLLACLSAGPVGADLVIDDFSAGPLDEMLGESMLSLFASQPGLPLDSTVGGWRGVGANLDDPGPADQARVTIDTDAGTFEVDGDVENYSLGYGSSGPSDINEGMALNLNVSSYDSLRIDVASAAVNHTMRVALRSGSNDGDIETVIQGVDILATNAPTSYLVSLASFDGVDLTNIDYITFSTAEDLPTGFGLTLSGMSFATSVPEPGSIGMLMTAAVAGLGLRRRRNREVPELSLADGSERRSRTILIRTADCP